MMRLRSDLLEVFSAMLDGTLDRVALDWDTRPAVGVVMASGGYPGDYAVGKPITGLDAFENDSDVAVFHAGTQRGFGNILTSGGRVLCVTAVGDSLAWHPHPGRCNPSLRLATAHSPVRRRLSAELAAHSVSDRSGVRAGAGARNWEKDTRLRFWVNVRENSLWRKRV